ncbi:MAG: MFS transporter [Cyanobacteria bacterium]|nr:MFS transporter [Cyanobacteriota bacterium]
MAAETPTEILPAEKKSKGISPLLIIFLTILIDMIGFGIVIPVMPLYGESLHASPIELGLLLSSFSAMQLLFSPIIGKWSDQVGRKPVLLICLVGTTLGFMILGFAHTLWMLFLGRMIDGISGGNISTAQAYIADITKPENRSRSMGIIGAAFGLGFMIGPAIGGLLGHYSLEAPFWFATGLSALNALAVFFFLPESLTPERKEAMLLVEKPSILDSLSQLKNTVLLPVMVCTLLSTIAFSGVTALFTLFTEHRFDWHAQENGWLFAYIGFLGVLVQGGLLGRLIKKCGEKGLIFAGITLLMISMFLFPLNFENAMALLWIASTGLSVGNSFLTPLLTGWASRSTDPQYQGIVLGIFQSIASLGRLIGPFLAGFLIAYETENTVLPYGTLMFGVSGLVMVLTLLVALGIKAASSPIVLKAKST